MLLNIRENRYMLQNRHYEGENSLIYPQNEGIIQSRRDIMDKYITTHGVTGREIRAMRLRLKMTQYEFSAFVGVSNKTVERWESSEDAIEGPVAVLMYILRMYPDVDERLKEPESAYPLRLIYRKGSMICSVIDVDEIKRLVKVTNYRYDMTELPFGNRREPTFEEYEEFLESRCFPRTRKWVDLELKKLGLPFYDPLMIIEKTEGRMVEDDFSIEVIRQ